MIKLNLRRAAAISAAALGLLAVSATAANAAPADNDGACVVRASGDLSMRCFSTFQQALQFASGGVLTDGPKNAQDALRDPAFDAKVDAANARQSALAAAYDTVVSIESDGTGYTNTTSHPEALVWVGTGPCTTSTNNTDYAVPTMPAGWVNVISSYRTYANCWTKHWENPSYSGASVGYNGSRSNIGAALDNRTSSEQWS
jgi:hypothetical protein